MRKLRKALLDAGAPDMAAGAGNSEGEKKMKDLLNCPNCGAPVADDFCPYCGSHFLDVCDVTPGSLVYLKCRPLRLSKDVYYVRAFVSTLSFDLSERHDHLYANDRIVYARSTPEVNVSMELIGAPDKNGAVITKYERSNSEEK